MDAGSDTVRTHHATIMIDSYHSDLLQWFDGLFTNTKQYMTVVQTDTVLDHKTLLHITLAEVSCVLIIDFYHFYFDGNITLKSDNIKVP